MELQKSLLFTKGCDLWGECELHVRLAVTHIKINWSQLVIGFDAGTTPKAAFVNTGLEIDLGALFCRAFNNFIVAQR